MFELKDESHLGCMQRGPSGPRRDCLGRLTMVGVNRSRVRAAQGQHAIWQRGLRLIVASEIVASETGDGRRATGTAEIGESDLRQLRRAGRICRPRAARRLGRRRRSRSAHSEEEVWPSGVELSEKLAQDDRLREFYRLSHRPTASCAGPKENAAREQAQPTR